MQAELIILLLGMAVGALGYIARLLSGMDNKLSVAVSKIETHGERLNDHESRIRKFESNY